MAFAQRESFRDSAALSHDSSHLVAAGRLAPALGLWNGAAMDRYDIALHGTGMLPGLLALHLGSGEPRQSVLFLSGDSQCCGAALEPVLEASLSAAALALVDPFVVASWPGYFVTEGGTTSQHDGTVLLLDPVQAWLELQERLPAAALVASCRDLAVDGETLRWNGGMAEAAKFVDLAPLAEHDGASEILGIDQVRSLPLPVLADLDTGDEPWDAFQHVPLGDERVYIRKRRCSGDPLAELTGGFGRILSHLVSD